MNQRLKILFVIFLVTGCAVKCHAQKLPSKKSIKQQMMKVANWQLAQPWSQSRLANGRLVMSPVSWEAGAFYPGIIETYSVTKDKKYLDAVLDVARNNRYKRGPQLRNADDQAILQTYLELYPYDNNPQLLEETKHTLDSIMLEPKNGAAEYSWCDLLFMGPPIWTRYASISKEPKYLDYLDKIYWEAVNNLQNKEYKLFYRDARFKTMLSTNEKPIFWSRGNGWVVAGLARLLDYIKPDDPRRKKYEGLLKDLVKALKPLQQSDGFWRSDLLNPDAYHEPETSGTVFFCYGIAWAINHNLVNKNEYLPSVTKAWNAINTVAVHTNGKLGFVQPGGDRPYSSKYEQSNWYAAGGYLMAAGQINKL